MLSERDLEHSREYFKGKEDRFAKIGLLGHFVGFGGDSSDLNSEQASFSFMAFTAFVDMDWLKSFPFPKESPIFGWASTIYETIRTEGYIYRPLYVIPIDFGVSSKDFIESHFNTSQCEKFIPVLDRYKETVGKLTQFKYGDIVEAEQFNILENYQKYDFLETWCYNHAFCVKQSFLGREYYKDEKDYCPEMVENIKVFLNSSPLKENDDFGLYFFKAPEEMKKYNFGNKISKL